MKKTEIDNSKDKTNDILFDTAKGNWGFVNLFALNGRIYPIKEEEEDKKE